MRKIENLISGSKVTTIVTLLAALLLAAVAYGLTLVYTRPVLLSTSSPNKIYDIEISAEGSRLRPFVAERIDITLAKGERIMTKHHPLHHIEPFEEDFLVQFPRFAWSGENVFRIQSDQTVDKGTPDLIVITNRSSKQIDYLAITSLDVFLLLEVAPMSTVKVPVARYSWQTWIEATGQFHDGAKIPTVGVNFLHKNLGEGPLTYCISVSEVGLSVRGVEVEGWSTAEPVIPKVRECSLP